MTERHFNIILNGLSDEVCLSYPEGSIEEIHRHIHVGSSYCISFCPHLIKCDHINNIVYCKLDSPSTNIANMPEIKPLKINYKKNNHKK